LEGRHDTISRPCPGAPYDLPVELLKRDFSVAKGVLHRGHDVVGLSARQPDVHRERTLRWNGSEGSGPQGQVCRAKQVNRAANPRHPGQRALGPQGALDVGSGGPGKAKRHRVLGRRLDLGVCPCHRCGRFWRIAEPRFGQ